MLFLCDVNSIENSTKTIHLMFYFINFIDFYKYLPILDLMSATEFKQVETWATKDTCLKQLIDKRWWNHDWFIHERLSHSWQRTWRGSTHDCVKDVTRWAQEHFSLVVNKLPCKKMNVCLNIHRFIQRLPGSTFTYRDFCTLLFSKWKGFKMMVNVGLSSNFLFLAL